MVYPGSKKRLSKDLIKIIQPLINDNNIELYVEPFVGGANLIDKINCKKRVGYDINKYLIALLQFMQNKDNCYIIPKFISKEQYTAVKQAYLNGNTNGYEDWFVGLCGFCLGYNGKFFDSYSYENKSKDRNYYDERVRNIAKQDLTGIEFVCKDFKDIVVHNALIYCDPPYKNTSKLYENNTIDQTEFYEWCKQMKSNNNIILISEYEMPKDKYKCIWKRNLTTTFSHFGKTAMPEKLFILKE